MPNLGSRIDKALAAKQLSRQELADAVGVSRQNFQNLHTRPNSTMRPENVAHIARHLDCDLYWLCTGEGGEYVPANGAAATGPAGTVLGRLAQQCAERIALMSEPDQWKAFAMVSLMASGEWPQYPGAVGSAAPGEHVAVAVAFAHAPGGSHAMNTTISPKPKRGRPAVKR